MITLRFPSSIPFFTHTGFGPFFESFETEKVKNASDFLNQKPGIFGENHCVHRKTSGTVTIYSTREISSHYKSNQKYYLRQIGLDGRATSKQSIVEGRYLRPTTPWIVGFDYSPGGQNWYSFTKKISPVCIIKYELAFHRSSRLSDRFLLREELVTDGTSQLVGFLTQRDYQYIGASFTCPLIDGRMPTSVSEVTLLLDQFLAIAKEADLVQTNYSYTNYEQCRLMAEHIAQPKDRTALFRLLNSSADYRYPDILYPDLNDITKNAVASLDSNQINMFEFFQGLKKPWELLPKLKNLGTLRNASENYLTLQYGILPTTDDLKDLYDLFVNSRPPKYRDRNGFETLSAGASVASSNTYSTRSVTSRVKLGYDDSNPLAETLSERLRDMGAFPSVDNLWELIPFSFVVDWFLGVGDLLETIDVNARAMTIPIKYTTTSHKDVVDVDIGMLPEYHGMTGNLTFSLYSRSVSRYAPSLPLDFEVSNELPNHWLEAGALIIANRKK